jgi:hypothetical protein
MALKSLEQRRAEKQATKAVRAQSPTSKANIHKKAKKAASYSYVRAGMVGFTLEWSDTDPLGHSGTTIPKASNTNPLQFNSAQAMWDDMQLKKWIVESVFTWVAEITLVFKLIRPRPGKTHREDVIHVRHTGRLRDPELGENTPINNEIERQIMAEFMANAGRSDTDKNNGTFEIANYRIVCVGQ